MCQRALTRLSAGHPRTFDTRFGPVTLRRTPTGQLFRDEEGQPSTYSTGHGDLVDAIRRAGFHCDRATNSHNMAPYRNHGPCAANDTDSASNSHTNPDADDYTTADRDAHPDGDADRDAWKKLEAIQMDGFLRRCEQLSGKCSSAFRAFHHYLNDGEFITTNTSNKVINTSTSLKSFSDLLQQHITKPMSEGIVD